MRKPSESIAAIVMSEKRSCQTVCHHIATILESERPMMKPDMIAAIRIAEPVAESQFKPKTAASADGLATTGGTRCTIWLRPVTGICGLVIALGGVCQLRVEGKIFSGVFMSLFPVVVPQQKTRTLRMSHGSQARTTSRRL